MSCSKCETWVTDCPECEAKFIKWMRESNPPRKVVGLVPETVVKKLKKENQELRDEIIKLNDDLAVLHGIITNFNERREPTK